MLKYRLPCGLFTLLDTDSDIDLNLDSKPDGYIVLYRNCSDCTDLDQYECRSPVIIVPTFVMDICIQIRIRVRVRQCKSAITMEVFLTSK